MSFESAPSPVDEMLDQALSRHLKAPQLPSDFRAHVLAAVARVRAPSEAQARQELERVRTAALAELNRRYLRYCRDALLVGLTLSVVISFGMRPLTLWLMQFFSDAAPLVAGVLILGAGVLVGLAFKDLIWARQAQRR
jgi:hypothetical protein